MQFLAQYEVNCLFIWILVINSNTIYILFNFEQALGCSHLLGYRWTLVRSNECWWMDSPWANFGCRSSKVIWISAFGCALFFLWQNLLKKGYVENLFQLCTINLVLYFHGEVMQSLFWCTCSKVPEEFVPQLPTNGNPPTLFLVLRGKVLF